MKILLILSQSFVAFLMCVQCVHVIQIDIMISQQNLIQFITGIKLKSMMWNDDWERRKSMEFIVKPMYLKEKILPRIVDVKKKPQINVTKKYERYIETFRQIAKFEANDTRKKPILFQMNLEEQNLTVYRRPDRNIRPYNRFDAVLMIGSRKMIQQQQHTSIKYKKYKQQRVTQQNEFNDKLAQLLLSSQLPTQQLAVSPTLKNNKKLQWNGSVLEMTGETRFSKSMKYSSEKKKRFVFDNYDNKTYKYYVAPGNNPLLVKRILGQREDWVQTSESNSIFNLKWTQTSDRIKFDMIESSIGHKQIVNHFEFHEEITTKSGLLKNLKSYCEKEQKFLFEITPITFQIDFTQGESCENDLKRFLHFFIENQPNRTNNTNIINTGKIKKKDEEKKININVEERKIYLDFLKKLRRIYHIQDISYEKKENMYSKPVLKEIYTQGDTYLWLLKPTGLNRGRGIYLFRELDELMDILDEYFERNDRNFSKSEKQKQRQKDKEREKGVNNNKGPQIHNQTLPNNLQKVRSQSFVIQKYIERPMLLHKRKFDIRVWALLTHEMELFFFKEGYARTSCEQFVLDKRDLYIHLTNNAVQKYSANYGNYEKGNQLSFNDLEILFKEMSTVQIPKTEKVELEKQDITVQNLESQNQKSSGEQNPIMEEGLNIQSEIVPETPIPISFRGDIVPEIKKNIMMSVEMVKKKLNANNRKYCFEIFGYDFMVDETFKLWLIQINTNPCIEESSPILEELLPRMLDDAFKLTIDRIVKKKGTSTHLPQFHHPVKGYPDDENMWEWLTEFKPEFKKTIKR